MRIQIDTVNKWLTAIQSIVIIVGLVFTVLTLKQLVDQTKIQNESLAQTQAATSAEYDLQMVGRLDEDQYTGIYSTIEYGKHDVPLLSTNGGSFSRAQVEDYIDNFDDIGTLVKSGVIQPRMAYDDFSDQVESAWCNSDVQKVVNLDRSEDLTKQAVSDPYYAGFEYIAKLFLSEDGGCSTVND